MAINWKTFDLNLLMVFDAIMQEKNLTRAGQRLGVSQPAVSHALARLRHMLNDELLVRSPDGMLPTPRAEHIFEAVHQALQELRVTLESDEFDPFQATRTFTIAANNYAARAIIPGFVRRIAHLAPGVVLDVRPIGMLHMLDQLDAGTVEIALSPIVEGSGRFKCLGLVEDVYVAIMAHDHPIALESTLTMERLANTPHIAITSSGDDTNFVDDALAEHGLRRHICAKLPLHSLLPVLTGSPALTVVPRRVALDFMAFHPMTIRPLPFSSPRISLSMIWHRRLDENPAHRWLRNELLQSAKEV